MNEAKTLDPGTTINAVIEAWPETVAVFQRLGLDACCGGSLPIREAAERHGLDVDAVVEALKQRS